MNIYVPKRNAVITDYTIWDGIEFAFNVQISVNFRSTYALRFGSQKVESTRQLSFGSR